MGVFSGHFCRLSAVAVVRNKVGAAVQSTRNAASGAKGLDAVGDSSRGAEALKNLKVQSEANNMGGSHGGTAEAGGSAVTTDVRGEDGNTRSQDIDTSA